MWIPTFYMTHSAFWAFNGGKSGMDWTTAWIFVILGAACIIINYEADVQRQVARETSGNCLIWGKKPRMIQAKYTTKDGTERTSLLLMDGYWAWARHFHYVPEILLSLFWSVPYGFTHMMPFLYVMFLTVLLFDRAFRDDQRCSDKYGKYWKVYQDAVPYKVIPGIL